MKHNDLVVCMLTSVHKPYDTRIFSKEAKSLVEAGYDVKLIVPYKGNQRKKVDDIEIIPVNKPDHRAERMTKIVYEVLIQAIKEDADVYHFHDPELIPVGLLLKSIGKKVIYDIHEDYSKNILDRNWIKFNIIKKIISFLFNKVEKISSLLFDYNICVLDTWEKKYKKGAVIKNYSLLPDICNKSLKNNKENKVVYIGSLGFKRGIIQMIEGFKLATNIKKDIHLDIIGDWANENIKEKAMKIIENNDRINYLGYLPFKEAKNIIKRAKLGVCLYTLDKYEENIPVKIYEYLSFATPVICTSFSSWKKVEKEGWGRCVDPFNYNEVADMMIKMLDDNVFDDLYKNCLKYRHKYSWENEEKKLVELYKNL